MCEFDAEILSKVEEHFPPGLFWFILNTLLEGLVTAIEENRAESLRDMLLRIGRETHPDIKERTE